MIVNTTNIGGVNISGLLKTGQTVSYAVGDDGDLELGLSNVNRFTAENIGGVDVVKDSLTGLMWLKHWATYQQFHLWAAAVAYWPLQTIAGFSDWRLPNKFELESIINIGATAIPWLYPYFTGVSSTQWYWTSSTFPSITTLAHTGVFNQGFISQNSKTQYPYYSIPCRKF